VARTLGDLKARIADELARADLTSQIALAIPQAIEEACTHHFWFMEYRGIPLSMTAGTAIYTSTAISNLVEIQRVALLSGSQHLTLDRMTDMELDYTLDGSAPSGTPYAYAQYNDQIAFYPTPNQTHTAYVDGLTHGAVLSSDSDSNIWTDTAKGERFVRALAKRQIYADIIRDTDKALVHDNLAQRYRQELFEQTHSRLATNEMAAYV
jgi:hypothetical protein